MDTKFSNNSNDNDLNKKKLSEKHSNENNSNENDLTKKIKVSRSFLVILFLTIILLSSGVLMINRNYIETENNYLSNYEINQETIRYAKNLERYFIYFEDFDPDKAYDKIKSLKSSIYDIPDTAAPDENGVIEEDTNEEASIELLERTQIYDSQEDSNEVPIIEEYEVSAYNEENTLIDNLIGGGSPAAYLNRNADNLNYSAKLEYINNLSELLKNYQEIKSYLDRNQDFRYYIKRNNNEVYTNSEDFFNEDYLVLVNINDEIFKNILFNDEYIPDHFNKNNLSCQILIPKSVLTNKSSRFYYDLEYSSRINRIYDLGNKIAVVSFPCALILIVILFKKYREELIIFVKKLFSIYFKMPLIIKLFALFFCICMISNMGYYSFASYVFHREIFEIFFLELFLSCALILVILFIIHIFKFFRNPKIVLEEFEIKYCRNQLDALKYLMKSNNFILLLYFIFIVLIIIAATIFSVFIIFDSGDLEALIIVGGLYLIGLLLALTVLSLITAYGKISYYIVELSESGIKEIPEDKSIFMKPVSALNKINYNIKQNLENAIKNEKLKTELITNVSHDLKTPLTSIINYIELLKDMRLNDGTAVEYIDIIDKKSQRLKILIEDLFEASKLAAGQLVLEKNEIDISDLLKQSLGELAAKINDKSMNFKTDIPDKPIILDIDGRRMWRAFDNLINNIIKYSPQGSRAFIDIEENEKQINISFKNTSEKELNFKSDELFERFKRGDSSRSTEGSGLGLSIAKNIVELHGGDINISIDGDLFKVIITLYK